MTAPDPKTVRKIARRSLQDGLHRLMPSWFIQGVGSLVQVEAGPGVTVETFTAWHEAVVKEVAAAQIAASWPDEQQPASSDRAAVKAAVEQLDAALRTVFGLRAPVLELGPQSVDALRTVLDALERLRRAGQQPAEATGGEQAQDGGPDDSFAMVAEGAPAGPARVVAEYWRDYADAVSDGGRFTDWAQIAQVAAWILAAMDAESEQVQDGAAPEVPPPFVTALTDKVLATMQPVVAMSVRHLLASRSVWRAHAYRGGAERDALAAQVAELKGEREADTRAVAALLHAQADGAGMAECKHAFAELRARFADRIAALGDDADGGAK